MRVAELEVVVTADASQAKSEMGQLDSQLQKGVGGFLAGEGLKHAGGGLLDFFSGFVQAGAEFSQQMVFVNAIIGGTTDTLDQLQQKALQMGETTIYSAQEAAQGMEQLAREGFNASQIIGTGNGDGLIDAALNLAGALDIDVPAAANLAGNAIRIFADQNLTGAQASDILTQAILRSGRPAAEFATGLQYIGSIADQLGIPFEDVAASLSELERQGIKARSAGTGLRQMLLDLADPTSKGAAAIANAGITAFDASGNFVGLDSVVSQFHDTLATMSDKDALSFLTDIFGKNAASPLLQYFRDGTQGLNDTKTSMNETGSAADIMKTRVDTLAGSFHMLASSWFTFRKVLGDSIGAEIKPVVDLLVGLVNAMIQLPTPVLAAIAALVGIGGVVLSLAGSLMIFNAVGGFEVLAEALGGIVALGSGVMVALLGVTAAVALLGLAWHDNFLGIRDELRPAWANLLTDFDAMRIKANLLEKMGMDPLLAWTTAFAQILRQTGHGDLADFVYHLGVLFSVIKQVAEGGQLMSGMLNILPGKWRLVGEAIGLVVKTIRDFIKDIAGGDLSKALDDLGKNLSLIGHFLSRLWSDDILPALENIDWNEVGNQLIHGIGVAIELAGQAVYPIAKLLIQIGAWGITALQTMGDAILDFVLGKKSAHGEDASDRGSGGRQGGIPLGKIAVVIEAWGISALQTMADAILDFVMGKQSAGGFPGMGGSAQGNGPRQGGIPLGSIAVSIADWIIHSAVSVSAKIEHFIASHLLGAANAIKSVAIDVADWVIHSAVKIFDKIEHFIAANSLGAAHEIKTVAIEIKNWAVHEATSLWRGIEAYVAILELFFANAPIGKVTAEIQTWAVKSAGELWNAVKSFTDDAWKKASTGTIALTDAANVLITKWNVTDGSGSGGGSKGGMGFLGAVQLVISLGIDWLSHNPIHLSLPTVWTITNGVAKFTEAVSQVLTMGTLLLLFKFGAAGVELAAALVGGLILGFGEWIALFMWHVFVWSMGLVGKILGFLGLSGLVKIGKYIVEGFIKGLDEYWHTITGWFDVAIGLLLGAIELILGIASPSTVFKQIGVYIIQGLHDGLAAEWHTVVKDFTDAVKWIKDQFTNAVSWLRPAGADIIQGLVDGTGDTWNQVVSAIDGGMGWILNEVYNVYDAANMLYAAGMDIVQGLANGIKDNSVVSAVTDSINYIVNLIPAPLRKILGWASPATLMIRAGKDTSMGLAIGLLQGIPDVTAAAQKVAQAVAGTRFAFPNGTTGALGPGTVTGNNGNSVAAASVGTTAATQVTNHISVTVPAADFAEWLDTVQFVQGLGTSKQVTLGATVH